MRRGRNVNKGEIFTGLIVTHNGTPHYFQTGFRYSEKGGRIVLTALNGYRLSFRIVETGMSRNEVIQYLNGCQGGSFGEYASNAEASAAGVPEGGDFTYSQGNSDGMPEGVKKEVT